MSRQERFKNGFSGHQLNFSFRTESDTADWNHKIRHKTG